MNELPLNALRAFAMVYAHGGVRAAARELGMAHSSVSRHLGELDRWLGVPLLRTAAGRGALVFTPQGEALGRATLAGLREIEQAVASLRETRPAHAVTLSASPSFAIRWLLPRLPALEKAHPKIELSVQVEQRLDALDDGRIDLAIRMGQGPWPALHAEPLMDDALYPVMSPALWQASGRPSRPAQLAGLRLLLTGDVEPPGQEVLARTLPGLEVDLLKVPHHGSRYQDLDWLRSLHAAVAFTSVGEDNDYGHPSPDVVAALEASGTEVLRTDTDGALALLRDGRWAVAG